MTQLHFRIIVIQGSDEEPDLSLLRNYIERCDLIVHSIKRVELEKSKQPEFSEILEYIVDVKAENQLVISNRNRVHVYKELIIKWYHVTNTICGERPLLQFVSNECFHRKRVSCHSDLSLYLSFGVQAKLGEFIEYFILSRSCTANFSHDLKELEIVTKTHISYERVDLMVYSCLRYRCDKIPIQFTAMSTIHKTPPENAILNFKILVAPYMWTAIINRTFLILEQSENIKASLQKLVRYSYENANCLEKVLTDVLFLIDSGRFLNYWYVIDKLYSHKMATGINNFSVPEKCRLIRRVVITPTRILLWPAELMCENRILRNFDSDFLLRVTFRDDDLVQMNYRRYNQEIFEEVVIAPMKAGLVIGGITAYDIRRWTEIDPRTTMNIPKCLARIGQCFSQTEDTLHIPLTDAFVRFQRDIERGLNPETSAPYVFSDGIGKISRQMADKVRKNLRHGSDCCAFQIRYSGCKGMLVLDPTLQGTDIVIRESMRKFDCRGRGHTKLEICKKSGPIPLRLNRPLIAILHDLGVEPRVFLRLQETMLQDLLDMLLDEEKAADYLNRRTPFSNFKFKELMKSGICLTTEPFFFRTLLLSLHRYYIDIIKTKANIDIDPAYGRNMFGVIDETGILEYGQVFVQYSADITLGTTTPDDTRILKGNNNIF
ncbi:RNA-dependent RNA polymerase 6 [Caerostris extrusa]|uniref:RNA-dependent RNA polymerase n=1 Tax=Caerostris extrusa TaxID=172846 RepID=A0AAV4PTE5_CAEEX|nr:RNA-dependent RNA polymerase 6 [Caerostris extrusa]